MQDEKHVLLDSPTADLTELHINHHLLFCTLSSDPNRLRDFVGQVDTKGLAFLRMSAWNAVHRFQNANLIYLLMLLVAGMFGFI